MLNYIAFNTGCHIIVSRGEEQLAVCDQFWPKFTEAGVEH